MPKSSKTRTLDAWSRPRIATRFPPGQPTQGAPHSASLPIVRGWLQQCLNDGFNTRPTPKDVRVPARMEPTPRHES
jgi:hypothetical protein